MFIIKTQTRKCKDTKYYTFKLVENSRTPTNKIYRKTLLNLGHNYSYREKFCPKSMLKCELFPPIISNERSIPSKTINFKAT